ncbi:MAG: PEP-CTERM sorting domain-containing protein [Nostoc sp. CreGUA01]
MKTLIQALSITAVALSLSATPGTAADFLISDFNNTLYDFTPGTGGAVNPRSINVLGGRVLDIDTSADGTLFGLTTINDNSLYKINPSTGNATLVGNTGLTIIEGDIGFDLTTGTLYGLYDLGNFGNSLFTLNTSNGTPTIIGSVAGDDPSGLAFDNAGNLFVINSNTNTSDIADLLKVDSSNGNVLETFSTNTAMGSVLGLDFDPDSGQLFAVSEFGNFYSINPTNGTTTFIDRSGVQASGLALVSVPVSIPEPTSWLGIVTVGAAGILWKSKKKTNEGYKGLCCKN